MDLALVAAAYNREADQYDERFREQQTEKHRVLAAQVPAPASGWVLDAGGGTGLLAPNLASVDPGWTGSSFLVADASERMLRIAQARGQGVVQADVSALPFRKAAFERVFCVTGLVDAAIVERALTGFARVTLSGGFVALTLRPRDVPASLEARAAELPLEPVWSGSAAGDRCFVWRRL